MARVTWPDLECIYAVTVFGADSMGTVTIMSQDMLKTLLLIDQDDDAAELAQACYRAPCARVLEPDRRAEGEGRRRICRPA